MLVSRREALMIMAVPALALAVYSVYAGVTCHGTAPYGSCRFDYQCEQPGGAEARCKKIDGAKRCLLECKLQGRGAMARDCPQAHTCTAVVIDDDTRPRRVCKPNSE
jgi:hypothetical protein